jgi:hypothetical protein
LDKASVFVPAYDKESGLGFWICREFIRSIGGGIGIVTLENSEPSDGHSSHSPPPGDAADAQTQAQGQGQGQGQPSAGVTPHISPDPPSPTTSPPPPFLLSRSTTPPIKAGEELCALIIDLPVVNNDRRSRFIELSDALSGSLGIGGEFVDLLRRMGGRRARASQVNPASDVDLDCSASLHSYHNNSVLSQHASAAEDTGSPPAAPGAGGGHSPGGTSGDLEDVSSDPALAPIPSDPSPADQRKYSMQVYILYIYIYIYIYTSAS